MTKAKINDAKVRDLQLRMMKLTTRSNMTIAEVASAYYNCLAGLALEASGHDRQKAAKLLRDSVEEIVQLLEDPSMDVRVAVENGKVVDL